MEWRDARITELAGKVDPEAAAKKEAASKEASGWLAGNRLFIQKRRRGY